MYESPIKVFQGELETQLEGEILKAVHRIDVTVDRDELIRALRYDREQYQKGFDDARKDAVVVTRCKDCARYQLGLNWCGRTGFVQRDDDFCSHAKTKED